MRRLPAPLLRRLVAGVGWVVIAAVAVGVVNDGEGSSLATTDTAVPGLHWSLATTQLDGGAGRVPLAYSGSSCAEAQDDIPRTVAVRVTMPDRSVYPFEVPLDRISLSRAIALACGTGTADGTTTTVDPTSGAVVTVIP